MGVANNAVATGWKISSVHDNMKGVKWTGNLTTLQAAGGKHLKLLNCYNVGIKWKKANSDGRIQKIKTPWSEQ